MPTRRIGTVGNFDIETGLPRQGNALNDSDAAKAIFEDRSQLGLWLMNSIWTTGTYDLMADLEHIRVPTLLLYGSEDWLLATGRNLQAIEGAELKEVPQAGHHAPLDQPRTVATEVQNFVDALTSQASTQSQRAVTA